MGNFIPGLNQEVLNCLCTIFSDQPAIEKAILYGSRAKGTHRPYSDVDITLTGQNVNLGVLNKVSHQIDELDLPWMFDISSMSKISNPDLLDHINRAGLEIYPELFTKIIK